MATEGLPCLPFQVNLSVAFLTSRQFLPLMKSSFFIFCSSPFHQRIVPVTVGHSTRQGRARAHGVRQKAGR